MALADRKFADLIIGADYAEFTRVPGASMNPVPVPEELLGEVDVLRRACRDTYDKFREEEFSIRHGGQVYRAAMTPSVGDESTVCLRRTDITFRTFSDLAIPSYVAETFFDHQMRGLLLVVGAMVAGKTNTAQSICKARMERLGGLGIAMEDPPETGLNGAVRGGRWIQMWARSRNGGYPGALKRSLRTGADMFFLGEIRDEVVAREVASASCNGHWLASTMHADSIAGALVRFENLCRTKDRPEAWDLLAQGLSAVIWQELIRIPQQEGNEVVRVRQKTLLVRGKANVQAMIRKGSVTELEQAAEDQGNRQVWRGSKPGSMEG